MNEYFKILSYTVRTVLITLEILLMAKIKLKEYMSNFRTTTFGLLSTFHYCLVAFNLRTDE